MSHARLVGGWPVAEPAFGGRLTWHGDGVTPDPGNSHKANSLPPVVCDPSLGQALPGLPLESRPRPKRHGCGEVRPVIGGKQCRTSRSQDSSHVLLGLSN